MVLICRTLEEEEMRIKRKTIIWKKKLKLLNKLTQKNYIPFEYDAANP